MRKSLSAIKSRVLQRTNFSTQQMSLTNSSTDGDSILGDIVNERASLIQGTADFSWARKTWSFQTAGQAQANDLNPTFYPLPMDFKHELSVAIVGLAYPLAPMDWSEYKLLEPYVRAVGGAYRYMYGPGGDNICFYPSPANELTVTISYATKPFVLFNDASYPTVPPRVEDEYFRCLLEGCAMDVFRCVPGHENQALEAERRYGMALIDLKKASKMNGLIVPVLQPAELGAGLPSAVLPANYPWSGAAFE